MVECNHWDQWFSDGFGVRQPLVTMVFNGCAPLVRRWNGYVPSSKSIWVLLAQTCQRQVKQICTWGHCCNIDQLSQIWQTTQSLQMSSWNNFHNRHLSKVNQLFNIHVFTMLPKMINLGEFVFESNWFAVRSLLHDWRAEFQISWLVFSIFVSDLLPFVAQWLRRVFATGWVSCRCIWKQLLRYNLYNFYLAMCFHFGCASISYIHTSVHCTSHKVSSSFSWLYLHSSLYRGALG